MKEWGLSPKQLSYEIDLMGVHAQDGRNKVKHVGYGTRAQNGVNACARVASVE